MGKGDRTIPVGDDWRRRGNVVAGKVQQKSPADDLIWGEERRAGFEASKVAGKMNVTGKPNYAGVGITRERERERERERDMRMQSTN